MLSTLSSFLPPVLQLGSQDKNSPTSPHKHTPSHNPDPASNNDDNDMSVDEHGAKKKKERTHEVLYLISHHITKILSHPLPSLSSSFAPLQQSQTIHLTSRYNSSPQLQRTTIAPPPLGVPSIQLQSQPKMEETSSPVLRPINQSLPSTPRAIPPSLPSPQSHHLVHQQRPQGE